MPLSDTSIRKAKPNGKPYLIRDDKGLYLEVRPTGTESWKLRVWEDKKERKITLGTYPKVSLSDTRAHYD